MLSPENQIEILSQNIDCLVSKEELLSKLKEERPLVVKAGFDPTAPDLHLGHTITINKLKQFQDLGHIVVFVIGDFTAKIGDPTGKTITRPPLSREQVSQNAATYIEQVGKILDISKTLIRPNSFWYDNMSFEDSFILSSQYSVARILERDDFRKRLKELRPLSMHELLYPLAQGYDSVYLNADIEIGGSDQRFNLLVGRDLMKSYGKVPQCIMTMPLLEGIDAQEENGFLRGNKMSKSLNNYIGLNDKPLDQFGKVMSICDILMWKYFALLTDKDLVTMQAMHPKSAKEILAHEIVKRYHGEEAAMQAAEEFKKVFSRSKDQLPDDAPTFEIDKPKELVQVLLEFGFVKSKGEGRRLVEQGGVYIDGQQVKENITIHGAHILRAGKKHWARTK